MWSEQLGNINIQGTGDFVDGRDGGIPLSPFNAADVCPVDADKVGKPLLRPFPVFPQLPYPASKFNTF